jgi:hypothetical protein
LFDRHGIIGDSPSMADLVIWKVVGVTQDFTPDGARNELTLNVIASQRVARMRAR